MSAARSCPVCGAPASVRKFEARDHHYGIPGRWWVRECESCQSYFLESPPTQPELAAMYADEYYSYAVREPSRIRAALKRLLRYSRDTRDPVFAAPGSVLDFGCGAGEYLLRMRGLGWRCAGVEVNATARERARASGLDVRAAIDGTDGFADASFDYVRANHSLEHVLDPGETLRSMHRVLKPGGMLFLGVPTTSSENARRFGEHWWHVTAPLHTFVPSREGLTGLLRRTGFRVVKTSTNGDFAGTAGSLQIRLNRGSDRRSHQGILFRLKPLLLLGQWYSRIQDRRGVGDKLEIIAARDG